MPVIPHHGLRPRLAPGVFLAEGAVLIGDVEVGRDASIWFGAVLRGDINGIRIGDRTNIQDGCILHVTHEYGVRIGKDVTVGHAAVVHGCSVADGALIGMGAVVLDNARIGSRALVAAGALVPENFIIPDGMLAAGVPARLVRPLSEEEQERLLESAAHYVQYAASFRTP